jgi:hypothetical protein
VSAEIEAQRTPATMNLLPGAGAEVENGEARKETMELFPQNAGFGSVSPDARYGTKRTPLDSIRFSSTSSWSDILLLLVT